MRNVPAECHSTLQVSRASYNEVQLLALQLSVNSEIQSSTKQDGRGFFHANIRLILKISWIFFVLVFCSW